ncbi:MAG TPA: BamA/TamA family outer membrane protein [Candidatus Krumholzibacteria bacterium]|nr:BamA/TamA family outer membrane protein [Candidatus Krumholzibacteria bacterium]
MTRTALMMLVVCLAGGVRAQAPDAGERVAARAELAAEAAPADSSRGGTVVLPVLGYTPDTGLMFGGFALKFLYLDRGEGARPSTLSPVVIYTLKNQVLAFLGADLNWGGGRWHASLVPGYQKFPDDWYGIGRDAPADPLDDYTPEQFSFEGMIERVTWGELRLGLGLRALKHQVLATGSGGALGGGVPGAESTVLVVPGVLAAWDTRDNTWSPRRGRWLQGSVGFSGDGLGGDYTYTDATIDLRTYHPLGEGGALAGQVLLRSLDGTAPFFELPTLGGQSGLRGYQGARFRDAALALARVEWRSGPVWKRFGGVLFAGMGDVAPSAGRLTTAAGLTTVGLGLRWMVNPAEKVNIRMDFGFGNGDSGFYLSLGEAF